MWKSCRRLAYALALAVSSGCVAHDPHGLAYTRDDARGVGVTGGAGEGAVGGGSAPPARSDDTEKRGNTPPGYDRSGHGPAAGAIIDPTGAATRDKPY